MRYLKRLVWAALVAGATSTPAFAQGVGGGAGGGGGIGGGGGSSGGLGGSSGGAGGAGGGLGGSALTGSALNTMSSAPSITAASTTGTSTSSALSQSNFLGSTYANPLYQGRAGCSPTDAPGGFGTPLYTSGGTTGGGSIGYAGSTTGTTGGIRGTTGARGSSSGTSSTTSGILIPPPVQISAPFRLQFASTAVPTNQLQAELSGMIARSTMIANPAGVQVSIVGGSVTLRGTVKDLEEAKLIRGMVGSTPGVREVKNELVIASKP